MPAPAKKSGVRRLKQTKKSKKKKKYPKRKKVDYKIKY